MKRTKRITYRIGLPAILVAALIAISGCGMANNVAEDTAGGMNWQSDGGMFDEDIRETNPAAAEAPDFDNESGELTGGDLDLPALNPDPNRKIVVTTALELETTDFDNVVDQILNQLVPQFNGYVESSEIYNNRLEEEGSRYAAIKLRIPTEDYSQAVTTISNLAHLVLRTDSAEDVTLNYVDTESHITALETEQETLLDLLEQAESVEDIISIQGRLTQVRYELEYYTSQLRQLDNLIDYTTLTLSLQEVRRVTTAEEEDFFTEAERRLNNGWDSFVRGLRGTSLNVIGALPWLVLLLILLVVLLIIIRATRPGRQRRRARKAQQYQPAYHMPAQPNWQESPAKRPAAPPQPPQQQAVPPAAEDRDVPPDAKA